MADYDRIPLKKSENVPKKLKEMFPGADYTEAVLKLMECYSGIGAELGRRAIWINEETYSELNSMGKVEDDFDDVIDELIKFRRGTY